MKRCNTCGKEIKSQEEQDKIYRESVATGFLRHFYTGSFCDGILTYDTNPFAVEIHNDFSKSWDCEGNRYEAMMDI